jgi:Ca2+-binding RTX toxin-like protein
VQIALSQTDDVPFETEEILNNVENLVGSVADDWLWGDDEDNKLEGGLGSDILHGGAGNDDLDGGRGSYKINDFDGEDYAIGNVLIGGDGDDIVRGGFYSFENADPFPGESDRLSATDIFVGGDGNDTYISGLESNALLWYGGEAPGAPFFDDLPDPSEFGVLDLPSRVDVDLVNRTVRKFDGSGNSMGVDTLENIIGVMGSAGNDTFLASSNQEILLGGEGNDRFVGGEANTETPWSNNRLEARDFFMGNGGDDVFRPAAGHTEIIGGLGNDRIFINDSGFVIVQGDEVFDADTSDTDTLDFSTSDKEWIIDATGEYFGDPSKDARVIDQIASTGRPDVALVDVGSAEGYDSGSRAALTLKSYADYDSVQDRLVWNTFGGLGFSAERNVESYEAEVLDPALDYVEFLQIENIFGSRYNDFIAGNDFANKLMGKDGDDVIIGHLNADGSGDTLFGEAGDDVLLGAENDDTLSGGIGDDLLIGGKGSDILQGQSGFDTVDYAGSNRKVFIDLTAGTAENGHASGDKLTNIESIIGTRFNDILKGSDVKNELKGGRGADLIIGTKGNDVLNGGKGTDTLSFASLFTGVTASLRLNNALTADSVYNIKLFENAIGTAKADLLEGNKGKNKLEGSGGGDTLNGLGENDLLIGGRGNDILAGGSGEDSLDGGRGFDIADYSASNQAVQVNLKTGNTNGGHATRDTFNSVEGLVGSKFNDTLRSNSGANTISGGRGDDLIVTGKGRDSLNGGAGDDTLNGQKDNDSLNGGRGNDRIEGGAGNDKLWGAQGKDIFVFSGDTDTGRDRIKDFNNGVDIIEISGSTTFADLKITKKSGDIKIEWADNIIFLEDESGPINRTDFDFV